MWGKIRAFMDEAAAAFRRLEYEVSYDNRYSCGCAPGGDLHAVQGPGPGLAGVFIFIGNSAPRIPVRSAIPMVAHSPPSWLGFSINTSRSSAVLASLVVTTPSCGGGVRPHGEGLSRSRRREVMDRSPPIIGWPARCWRYVPVSSWRIVGQLYRQFASPLLCGAALDPGS